MVAGDLTQMRGSLETEAYILSITGKTPLRFSDKLCLKDLPVYDNHSQVTIFIIVKNIAHLFFRVSAIAVYYNKLYSPVLVINDTSHFYHRALQSAINWQGNTEAHCFSSTKYQFVYRVLPLASIGWH